MQQPTVNLDSTDNQPPRHHTHSLLSASREGISNNLYHTPTPATTDSEVLGNLPSSCSTGSITRGYLFSPMENSANVSGSSFILGSLITPKRKLSLSVDLDESTQDVSDSGYSRGESISSTSSYNTHESGLSFSSALEGIVKKQETTSALAHRTPLGDVTNTSGTGEMRQHSQKAKRSISFPNEEKSKKMSASSENQDPICFHTRISSLPPLLSSQDSINHRKNSLHQISSPLERMTLMSPTPTTTTSRPLYSHNPRRFVFPTTQSLREHSVESDGYSEVFDGDDLSSNTNTLPSGLTGLMNAPFTSSTTKKEVLFSLHKPPVHSTPMVQSESGVGATRFSLTRADSWCPTTSHTSRGSLKRASPCPDSSEQPKKKKPPLPVFDSKTQDPTPSKTSSPLKGVQLLRSQSCSFGASGHNMFPLSPGDNGEMIGDHSKSYALPLCKRTSVPDLKCISPHTLAELVNDDSGMSVVDEYLILDCRYPYEYEGGHIRGAQNVWNRDTLQNQFFTTPEYTAGSKRRIIIFHCEFSSKRGPDMSRFMREIDRKKNGVAFPKLYYPELYLLEGGYKAFYEQFPDLCEPNSYVKMLDDKHKEELRHFKHRSKSWTGGDGATCKRRGSKLRPRRSTIDSHREIKMLPSKS